MIYEETIIRERLSAGDWTPASVVKIKRMWEHTSDMTALELAGYAAEEFRVEIRQLVHGNTLLLNGMVKQKEDGPWQVSCTGECQWFEANTEHGIPLAALEISARRLIRCHILASLVNAFHELDESEVAPVQ